MIDPAKLSLSSFLSTPRFNDYLDRCGHDSIRAARLYAWNHEIAGTFLGPLAILEIAMRNAMNSALSSQFGPDWISDPNSCDLLSVDRKKFEDTASRIKSQKGRTASNDQIVASSSFGDWVRLLDSGHVRDKRLNYEKTLWEPALQHAFPNREGMGRKELHGILNSLRSFRNRVVHHEPIHQRNHKNLIDEIVNMVELIDRNAAILIRDGNGVLGSVASRGASLKDGDCCI